MTGCASPELERLLRSIGVTLLATRNDCVVTTSYHNRYFNNMKRRQTKSRSTAFVEHESQRSRLCGVAQPYHFDWSVHASKVGTVCRQWAPVHRGVVTFAIRVVRAHIPGSRLAASQMRYVSVLQPAQSREVGAVVERGHSERLRTSGSTIALHWSV